MHLDAVFRQSSAQLVASLTRALGPSRLDLVESVVQEAFVRAMEEWKQGAPENPAAWLLSVARNLALDQLRRERSFREKEASVARFVEATQHTATEPPPAALSGELADEALAMMFVACHPCNTVPSQIALALRTLCGLEAPAIARALFSTEDAVEKRLVLARRRLREAGVSFELPGTAELGDRLDAVLRVLYLLFNEAYAATSGEDLVQVDVAGEAIRLTTFLAEHPTTRRPRVLALLALMHFHASRFPARVDAEGAPVTLAEQDRSLWIEAHVALGMRCLAASAEGTDASPYHYEAAIAAVHATSPSIGETDWATIVRFYDDLLSRYPSPGAQLSRAIALGFRDGPARCLEELDRLAGDSVLRGLAPFHAACGEARAQLGDRDGARDAFERARSCSINVHEQRYLTGRIARLAA